MVVIASKPGQLGNRLMVFAQFIAFSIENGVTVSNPSFDEYASWFPSTAQDLLCRFPPQRGLMKGNQKTRKWLFRLSYYFTRLLARLKINCRWIKTIYLDWDEHLFLDSEDFIKSVQPGQLVFVQGWQFRHSSAFTQHGPTIREFFRPLPSFESDIATVIEDSRRQCDILIGIHIRHGDYRTFIEGKYFFEVGQYTEIMRHAKSLFPNQRVAFLVCSNVQQKMDDFHNLQVFFGPDHPLKDMYSLAKCDYIIGPPSTFTMWASFYGKAPLYMIEEINQAPEIKDFVCFTGG